MHPTKLLIPLALATPLALLPRGPDDDPPDVLHVHADDGKDTNAGTERRPLRTLSAALALLPDPLTKTVTIEVVGRHESTGGVDMAENVLELAKALDERLGALHIVGDRLQQVPQTLGPDSRPVALGGVGRRMHA